MRLLDTTTLELHDFLSDNIPPYAILSHRWETDGEVTFQDLRDGKATEMAGFKKIQGCCARARSDSLQYAVSSCFLGYLF